MVDILHGKAEDKLQELDAESFDSCVTDPPYDLGSSGFMNMDWDNTGIAFQSEFWEEVKRVLKPGAHLLSFGGTKTHHRLMVAIEDAGFEIREVIMWNFAGGFPKNHDVSKAIDDHKGKKDERKKIGLKDNASKSDGSMVERNSYEDWEDNPSGWQERGRDPYKRAPATSEAEKWEGWGTALKPAYEPIVVARKPLEGTVAENVLKHGTGALNIDGCRIEVDPNDKNIRENWKDHERSTDSIFGEADGAPKDFDGTEGRWPTNILFDERASVMLDEQSGECKGWQSQHHNEFKVHQGNSLNESSTKRSGYHKGYDDTGGASRFFYCPKAKQSERHLGVEENNHPTVKPVELMSYLVRLSTPNEGKVLDPFGGSGTTGIACQLEKVDCTMIEMNEDYVDIAKKRNNYVKNNYASVREDFYGDPSNSLTEEQTEVANHNFW